MTMKTIKYSILALIAAGAFVCSCEEEPEVGSTLYPEAEETFEPRVYINETDIIGNTAELSVIQTPQDVLAPDNISFYLRLTKAAAEDVQVSVALDTPEAEGYTSLSSSSVNLINPTVTIPAGKLVSSEPVTLGFVMSEEFKGDWTNAITSVRISEVSSPDVLIGSDHNTLTAHLEKEFTNFKGQSSADLDGLVQIPYDSYTVDAWSYDDYSTYGSWEETSNLSDGSSSTFVGNSYGYLDIVITFDQPVPVSALSFCYYYYSGYCPKDIEIFTSDDYVNWTSQVAFANTLQPRESTEEIPVVFYSPLTCKYIEFYVYSCFYSAVYGNYYLFPSVSEMKLYTAE
ncbi:MAG: DUF1735 domain-containing protein [Candidatus Cryptobacteroides sp.]